MVGEVKRRVSVGFIKPPVLMGNTIYVQLSKKYNEGYIYAEALSNAEFNYFTRSSSGNKVIRKGREADNLDKNNSSVYDFIDFIENLQEANNADKTERFREEGLKLTEKLSLVKRVVSDVEENLLKIK